MSNKPDYKATRLRPEEWIYNVLACKKDKVMAQANTLWCSIRQFIFM